MKCFKHARILNDGLNNVHALSEDPFQDIDETITMGSLISTKMGTHDTCSEEEYVYGDDDLPVCDDLDDETWEENFTDNLAQEVTVTVEDESDVDEKFDLSPLLPKSRATKRKYNR